jgi:rhamnosyl/mannosyltransferase
MPRILHIGKYYPPFAGGMENFLADLMFAQAQQGDIVATLVHDHDLHWSRFFAPVRADANLFQTSNLTLYRTPTYGRLLYAPVSPQFPFWLRRILQDFQPQLLHLHLPNTSAFWALALPQARRLPWIIHWHSDVFSTLNKKLALAYSVYRPLEQRLLARAQAIIATSAPYLASSTALQPWQHKCQVIPLGLSLDRLPDHPTPQATRWAEQQWGNQRATKILCVGRLTYYKGHEILIQALPQITGGQVLIVGQGELRSRLETLITKLNLAPQVKLLGYCTDAELTALFATCDIFCLPSVERTEAFGVVLLEAMRYAKPIIASAIPGSGVTWVVQDKHTGLLVPPQDATALAHSLQQLIEEPSVGTHLGQAGYQRFMQLFDIKQIALKTAKLYQQVLPSCSDTDIIKKSCNNKL